MNHSFKTVLFGLNVTVEVELIPGEPQTRDYPGCEPECDAITITHKGTELEDIPDDILDDLIELAFESAVEELKECDC